MAGAGTTPNASMVPYRGEMTFRQKTSTTLRSNEFTADKGDSGGPWYQTLPDGRVAFVGVHVRSFSSQQAEAAGGWYRLRDRLCGPAYPTAVRLDRILRWARWNFSLTDLPPIEE